MNVVATLQDAHRLDRCEHILCANRAITVQRVLETDVIVEDADVDTGATLMAVLVVEAQTLAYATETTILAVED
jgi:hypothetical protein